MAASAQLPGSPGGDSPAVTPPWSLRQSPTASWAPPHTGCEQDLLLRGITQLPEEDLRNTNTALQTLHMKTDYF